MAIQFEGNQISPNWLLRRQATQCKAVVTRTAQGPRQLIPNFNSGSLSPLHRLASNVGSARAAALLIQGIGLVFSRYHDQRWRHTFRCDVLGLCGHGASSHLSLGGAVAHAQPKSECFFPGPKRRDADCAALV